MAEIELAARKELKYNVKSRGDQIFALIFSLYVGTGPVYWVPGMSADTFYLAKTILFIYISAYPLVIHLLKRDKGKIFFPGGPLSFALLLSFSALTAISMITAVANEKGDVSGSSLFNSIQIMIFLYSCGYAIANGLMLRVVTFSVVILSLFCMLSLLLITTNPGLVSPFNDLLTVKDTGLGGSRTGWSPSVALYLPWLYAYGTLPAVVSTAFFLAIISNQVYVASRTGLAASFVPFVVWGVMARKFRILLLSVFFGTVSVLLAINNKEALRLSKGGISDSSSLNELSTGRWEQYVVALKAIIDRPILGHGAGDLFFEGGYWYIHNVILKLAVEGGLLLAAIGAVIIALPVIKSLRSAAGNAVVLAALLTVVAGATTSLFEPGVMFGAFNQISFWWVCFAICVANSGDKERLRGADHG